MTYDLLILGGGIAGLATLHEALRGNEAGSKPRCLLVEAEQRLGGKVLSEKRQGFLLEAGADAVVPHKTWALELIRELGLESRLLPSRDQRRRLALVVDGDLRELPSSLKLFVPTRPDDLRGTALFSDAGLERLAQEREIPARIESSDESVADFVRRRFGSEMLEQLAEPILAHIHVADVERMSLQATYPLLATMERRHGSLINAFGAASNRPTSGPLFWTLRGGLGELTEALAKSFPAASLALGCTATGLERCAEGWRVRLSDGTALTSRAVVLALPAPAAARLSQAALPVLANKLGALRQVPLATASFGFRSHELNHPLEGFGFFVPRREQRRILACTWSSTKFEHRAAPGEVLLRVFLGGADGAHHLQLDDDHLLAELATELGEIMGFSAKPIMSRLFRWPSGYPQYDVGHLQRVADLELDLPPGLHLAGSAYHGVGIPDCIHSGRRAARAARIKTPGLPVSQ